MWAAWDGGGWGLSRVVLWHRGDPLGAEDGTVMDLEVIAQGGGRLRMRVDRATGGLIE